MKNETFTLETENGSIICEILDSLYVKEYQKNYLIYTDNSKDLNGELNIFISSYDPENPNYELNDVTNKDELEKITTIIEDLWNE